MCILLEDNLERERRKRTEEDKQRRRIEGDVKLAQEAIMELDKGETEKFEQDRG